MRRILLCLILTMANKLKSPKDRDNDPVDLKHDEQLEHLLHELIHELKKLMIAQTVLDASLKNLTVAVDAAIVALEAGSTETSTPDTAVTAFVTGVDAQSVRLAGATPPPVTPPTP